MYSMSATESEKVPERYREHTELTDAVLIVEEEKLHVVKAVSKKS